MISDGVEELMSLRCRGDSINFLICELYKTLKRGQTTTDNK